MKIFVVFPALLALASAASTVAPGHGHTHAVTHAAHPATHAAHPATHAPNHPATHAPHHPATVAPTRGPAKHVPQKGDFRDEFDHLMIATITEKMHDLDKFLLHLSEEVADLEKTHNAEEKKRILAEINGAEVFIHHSKGYFEKELKRTDLNILEKFNYELALATAQIIEKDFGALAHRVNAIKA